jgi:hypothetical protein
MVNDRFFRYRPFTTHRLQFTIHHSPGAETQDRTGDTSIFSAVLYRLSYLGKRNRPEGPISSERAMRFELTTFSLARRHSTAELRPQLYTPNNPPEADPYGHITGSGPGRIRTDGLLLAKETPSR